MIFPDLSRSVLQSAGQRAIPANLCVDVFNRFKKIPILVLTLIYTLSVFDENKIIALKLDCIMSTFSSLADAVSKLVSPRFKDNSISMTFAIGVVLVVNS